MPGLSHPHRPGKHGTGEDGAGDVWAAIAASAEEWMSALQCSSVLVSARTCSSVPFSARKCAVVASGRTHRLRSVSVEDDKEWQVPAKCPHASHPAVQG